MTHDTRLDVLTILSLLTVGARQENIWLWSSMLSVHMSICVLTLSQIFSYLTQTYSQQLFYTTFGL